MRVIKQTARKTSVKCLKCSGLIDLHHGDNGTPNDNFGRLDLGQQNYLNVVCMNRRNDRYCDWSKDVSYKELVK